MVRAWTVMGLCAAFGTGCGSSSDEEEEETKLSGAPLDCAWMASDNCWKTTVAAATSCVPPASEAGVLSADGASCSYASGPLVAFAPPLALPIDFENAPPWDFGVSRTGQECLSFHEVGESAKVLTVGSLTYEERYEGLAMQVTCPDGSQYAVDNAFDLFECENFFEDAPGYSYSSSDSSVTLSLSSGLGGGLQVFDCAR